VSKKKKICKKCKRQAIYKCSKCGFVYSEEPGPQKPCKKCGSEYFEWLNYEEFEIKTENNE
jgi:rubredoxin